MKKELIEKIMKDLPAGATTWEIEESLKKNLPDFSRIDEERIFDLYRTLSFKDTIKEYNSALPTALVPLPKEMPKDLTRFAMGHDVYEVWDKIISEYGTPEPKPSLPTVEELAKEMLNVWNVNTFNEVAEYVINKYSLHAREWWQDAIPHSTQFKYNDTVYTFSEYSYESSTQKTWIHNTGGGKILSSHCTHYTAPTADDIIKKHNLSEKEVKILREGKCT